MSFNLILIILKKYQHLKNVKIGSFSREEGLTQRQY